MYFRGSALTRIFQHYWISLNAKPVGIVRPVSLSSDLAMRPVASRSRIDVSRVLTRGIPGSLIRAVRPPREHIGVENAGRWNE